MSLTLTCVPRNAAVQADVPVDHFAAGVTAPDGWQWVAEWRFREDPGDDWSAPTIQILTLPVFATTFTPPGDGWVRLVSYAQQTLPDGRRLTSRYGYEWEAFCLGGLPYTPGNRITDAGDNRITDAGDTRITE